LVSFTAGLYWQTVLLYWLALYCRAVLADCNARLLLSQADRLLSWQAVALAGCTGRLYRQAVPAGCGSGRLWLWQAAPAGGTVRGCCSGSLKL
jgi:hypothetical protein